MGVHRMHADHARMLSRIAGPANTEQEDRLQGIYDGIREAARRGSTMVEFWASDHASERDFIASDLHMNGFSVVVLTSLPAKMSVCW